MRVTSVFDGKDNETSYFNSTYRCCVALAEYNNVVGLESLLRKVVCYET